MNQHPVEVFGYVRVNLFKIGHAVVKHDIDILLPKRLQGRVVLSLQFRYQHISHTRQKYQNVTYAKEVVAVYIFLVPVIKVEIDPAVPLAMAVYRNMIAPDISVLFAMFVKKTDGLDAFNKIF
jgi:hypothetical protein